MVWKNVVICKYWTKSWIVTDIFQRNSDSKFEPNKDSTGWDQTTDLFVFSSLHGVFLDLFFCLNGVVLSAYKV